MCGRYSIVAEAAAIRDLFELPDIDENLLGPRYNVAPTQPILMVREGERRNRATGRRIRELVAARWGLIPSWVKDPKDFPLLINARAEGVADKPSFRNAFKRRRCLIPASGFYEWQTQGKGKPKRPYWIRPDDGSLLAFAGLWECWLGADGSEVDTVAIITTEANASLKGIHHRMPVILQPDTFEPWLDAESRRDAMEALLRPAGDNLLTAIAVTTRVNAVRNDDADLWTPADTGEDDAT
ncbi:MAG: SOS response-associated peptidase [Alphaproteobacteria bacterium]